MIPHRHPVIPTISAVMLLLATSLLAIPPDLSQYNPVWTTQSKDSSESMPCGGGDIGLNVWVENGGILFYLARSGAFDGNNSLLKLGRVRLQLNPNPFAPGASFKQTLRLEEGFVEIQGGQGDLNARVLLWVDVFRPVVQVEIEASQPVTTIAHYESWRTEDRKHDRKESHMCYGLSDAPFDVFTRKDSIKFADDHVLWFHRNTDDFVFDQTVAMQGMDAVKSQLWNPVLNRTFGGILQGRNMKVVGTQTGNYLNTKFKAWTLKSSEPIRSQVLNVFLHIDQTETLAQWEEGLEQLIEEARKAAPTAKDKTQAWWHQFWDRSHIIINSEEDEKAWQLGRNYQLFRYLLGCNLSGTHPTKFNGGLFTFDPVLTGKGYPFTPDFRRWGGGSATAQNQRLVYWPMLKSGDFDLMKPQFDFYLKCQANAELRSRFYWNHNGACFTEQMENFGLPVLSNYGFKRRADYDPGICYSRWIEYQWDTVFEFCLMMLDLHEFTGADISEYIPLIESCLAFFDEHYQYYARRRTAIPWTSEGHYIFYPGTACETYKMARDSVTTVCGLRSVLRRLLALPDPYLKANNRNRWTKMLGRIPPISFREVQGKKTISPARTWERVNNHEFPQMYPVFPFGIYGIGRPDLDVAVNTWQVGYDRDDQKNCHVSWHQNAIFCARLGLTDEAQTLITRKLEDSGRRFPAFWGPGHDWTPDHNWGGSGMIGLQEMAMQTVDDQIHLFPAWPEEWDVNFKLHAPGNTVVTGQRVNGKVIHLSVTPEARTHDVILH